MLVSECPGLSHIGYGFFKIISGFFCFYYSWVFFLAGFI